MRLIPAKISNGKIITSNPVANAALNRDKHELQSESLKAIESVILKHAANVQDDSEALRKEIEAAQNKMRGMTIEKGRAKSVQDYDEYMRIRSELEDETERANSLIKMRDELLNEEIPASEYKNIVESAVSTFDRESSGRMSEITKLLSEAADLIEMQYDEAVALNNVLAILTKPLKSSQHDELIKSLPCYDYLGGIAVKYSLNLLRYRDWLNSCIKHLNKEYNH